MGKKLEENQWIDSQETFIFGLNFKGCLDLFPQNMIAESISS